MINFYDLFLVKKTVLKLASVRGFDITDDSDFEIYYTPDSRVAPNDQLEEIDDNISYDKFLEKYDNIDDISEIKELLSNLYPSRNKKSKDSLFVFFSYHVDDKSIGTNKSTIDYFIQKLTESKSNNGIIIHDDVIGKAGQDSLNKLKQNVDIFHKDELSFCPIEHKDVPKHVLLTDKEKQELLKEIKLSDSKSISHILKSDPVIKFYGWPVGSIVKIYRDDYYLNILTPKSINYRLITES
jgi:DNA-directed RNA polymerase I, II, and III subunit RPABC1